MTALPKNPLLCIATLAASTGVAVPAQNTLASASAAETHAIREGEMAGYLIVPIEKVPESFNAGFSMYVSAWPLLKTYPAYIPRFKKPFLLVFS